MKKLLPFIALVFIALYTQAQTITLTQFATGFSLPVDIGFAPGDDRLYVLQQRGRIRICDTGGNIAATDFMNISSLVSQSGNERGLLGIAFHPDYQNNGYFYVNYTRASNGATRISRFTRNSVNPDIADVNSEVVLLEISQPFSNHNGGCIRFGSDGYLYIGMGDGGSAGDPGARAQNPQQYLGKILKIDVNTVPYQIPPTNPFYNSQDTLPEIWAMGIRNPWRYSFDMLTHDLWIGDVGQDAWEEVDFQPAGSHGGENYGWRCYEGNVAYNTSGCQPQNFYDAPVAVYSHNGGNCSVTGGFVYRGAYEGDLYGKFIYVDYCSGDFHATYPDGLGGWTTDDLNSVSNLIVSFGQNHQGDLFVSDINNGRIYALSTTTCLPTASVYGENGRTALCGGDSLLLSTPAGTGFTYQWLFNTNPLAGATSSTYYANATGDYQVVVTDGSNCTNTSAVFTVSASTVPAVDVSVTSPVCENAGMMLLNGTPAGGTYSGTGVAGSHFYPSVSGVGTFNVYYTYTNAEGCSAGDSTQVTVNAVPVASITNLPSSYCLDDATISLNGTPSGGTFSGPGVTGSTFDPLAAGVGTHQVVYAYTDANSCSDNDTVTVTISDCDVSVEEAGAIQKWNMYPNPASGSVTLDFQSAANGDFALRIISIDGKVIMEKNIQLNAGTTLINLPLEAIAPGMYQVQLLGDQLRTRSLIITK